MKALVLEAPSRLVYKEVPDPKPGPGEVLVRVRACGICGSDVHGMDGRSGRRIPPLIMGHEAAGRIAALGPGVTSWRQGQRVTFDSTVYCGSCSFCRSGATNLCENRRVLGVATPAWRAQGAFAQYVVVPQHTVYELPPSLSFEEGALIEPLSVAFHAVERSAVKPTDSVLIVGGGVVGLFVLAVLRVRGCRRVVVVEKEAARREYAGQLGADEALSLSEFEAAGEGLFPSGGADVAFEAVGIEETVLCALRSLRPGGRCILVGNITPRCTLPLQKVVTGQISVLGSCASAGEYPACCELAAGGEIKLARWISEVAPLQEGPHWFERLQSGDPRLLKVVLVPP